jgi:hypothetical protein
MKIYSTETDNHPDLYILGIRMKKSKINYLYTDLRSSLPYWTDEEKVVIASPRMPSGWVFVSPDPETPEDANSFLMTYPEWIHDLGGTSYWISEGREPERSNFVRRRQELIAELKYIDRGVPPTSPRPPIEPIA